MMIPPDDPRMTPIALRKELIASGHTDRSLARALKGGGFARPRRGAYVDGAVWATMTPDQRYAVRSRAAYRQAQAGVVLSHVSTLPFFGVPLWGFDLSDAHVTRRDGKRGRNEAGVRQHGGVLAEDDVVALNDFAITSAVRTALDITMIAPTEPALCAVNHFLHAGDTTAAELRVRYDGLMDHWPGSLATDIVLRLADPRIETIGETRTMYACWRQHLPRPVPQYEVFDDSGRLIGRLDFAFPDYGVWLEFDGKVKYDRYRRPGESASDVVLREKRREEAVSEATGWRCVRITWADLADPIRLAARIRAAFEAVASVRRRAGA